MKPKAASKKRSKTATRFNPERLARGLVGAIRATTSHRRGVRGCAQWTALSAVRRRLDISEDDWAEAIFQGVKKGWLSVDPSLPPHSVCLGSKAPR